MFSPHNKYEYQKVKPTYKPKQETYTQEVYEDVEDIEKDEGWYMSEKLWRSLCDSMTDGEPFNIEGIKTGIMWGLKYFECTSFKINIDRDVVYKLEKIMSISYNNFKVKIRMEHKGKYISEQLQKTAIVKIGEMEHEAKNWNELLYVLRPIFELALKEFNESEN